jgi:P4 family phage/plasmid primase-like protien
MSSVNSNIELSSQYISLTSFLSSHLKTDNDPYSTHTKIPEKINGKFRGGGSYYIPKNKLPTFYKLYYDEVFINNKIEHITESHLKQNGPMVVDFDFKYDVSITERPHSDDHISDIISAYLDELKKCFIFKSDIPFNIFIFEKPTVNMVINKTDTNKSLTKDGIHMLIGLQIDHIMQTVIRNNMLETLKDCLSDLPLTNNLDNILDNGITKGTTNWQLYGSCKPDNEAYKLTKHYKINYDDSDNEWMTMEIPIKDFDLKNRFQELSVQYDLNPIFEINPNILVSYNEISNDYKPKHSNSNSNSNNKSLVRLHNDANISFSSINNIEVLDKAVDNMYKNFENKQNYDAIEAHLFAQILPDKYYKPGGSHEHNIKLAFALKNTDDQLFLSWIKVRSKASDFDFQEISNLHNTWNSLNNKNSGSVTKRSILYWAKTENFYEFEKIKSQTIDAFIEEAIISGTEYDFARVLKQMYKDTYVCTNYKQQVWYVFKNHKWNLDSGLSLRNKISTELFALLSHKLDYLNSQIYLPDIEDDRKTFLQKKIKVTSEVRLKLKKTSDKGNIMRESAELFFDGDFEKKINTNKYLLCFKNGVVDFNLKLFRDGVPEDYITMSTNIKYTPLNLDDNEIKTKSDQLINIMNKLFPIADLNNYMWEHLASCLIGTNKNHSFNVYHGSGSNGKSILADLMGHTLGEYKGLVPLALLTDKRGKIGGTSDEILKLRGIRYAVIQEPSKSDELNEGTMKELTGGDPLQARGLYCESVTFETQFSLVVCTNNLFDIKSNDDGTWRRIKKVDFVSKFIDANEEHTDDTQYVFPKDPSLKEQFPTLAPVFVSMLVKKAFETDGIVKDCATVINASKKYRNNQDYLASYVSNRIEFINIKTQKIGKVGLVNDFKIWYQQEYGMRKPPKSQELYNYMDKKFGPIALDSCWHSCQFITRVEDMDDLEALSQYNNS